MSDSVDKTKRSEVMKAVKSKGNKSTELKFIKLFKNFVTLVTHNVTAKPKKRDGNHQF